MFSAIGDFLRRRKSLFFWTAATTGGAYLLGKYAINRVQELTKRTELERLAQQNIKRRFEQNQQDCTLTILSLLPALAEFLLQSQQLDVESLTIRLKNGSFGLENGADAAAIRQRKLQLWQELKIKSIARTVASLYAVTLLAILLRIQLNLIGRYTYLESLDLLDSSNQGLSQDDSNIQMDPDRNHRKSKRVSKFLSFESEQKYLCISWYLINRGTRLLIERALEVTQQVFEGVDLGRKLSLEQFEDLLNQVRQELERADSSMMDYSMPPEGQEASVIRSGMLQAPEDDDKSPIMIEIEPDLNRMLNETREIMKSEEYIKVAKIAVDETFKRLSGTLNNNLFDGKGIPAIPGTDGVNESTPKIVELSEETVPSKPLASYLPETTKAAHAILNSYPNDYVKDLTDLTALNALAAIIYCRFESDS